MKEDMKLVSNEVMAHWYNIKGNDLVEYSNRFFDQKWNNFDSTHRD